MLLLLLFLFLMLFRFFVFAKTMCLNDMPCSHRYECRLNPLSLYGPRDGPERLRHRGGGTLFLMHMAMRAVMQKPPSFFVDMVSALCACPTNHRKGAKGKKSNF